MAYVFLHEAHEIFITLLALAAHGCYDILLSGAVKRQGSRIELFLKNKHIYKYMSDRFISLCNTHGHFQLCISFQYVNTIWFCFPHENTRVFRVLLFFWFFQIRSTAVSVLISVKTMDINVCIITGKQYRRKTKRYYNVFSRLFSFIYSIIILSRPFCTETHPVGINAPVRIFRAAKS